MPIQNNEINNAAVNMDIEEGRINHGASTDQPTAIDQSEGTNTDNNTNTSLATLSSGLQLMDDDNNDLPLPMDMAGVISNGAEPPKEKIGKVEQIDDNVGPEPPAAMLEASLNAADPDVVNKVTSDITNNLSSINQLSPPVPFNYAQFQAATDSIRDNKADLINQLSPPTPFHPHNVPDNKVLDINQLSPPVPFNFTEFERDDDVIKMNTKELMNQMSVAVSNNDEDEDEPSRTSNDNPVLGKNHPPISAARPEEEQSEMVNPPPPVPVSGNHNQVPDIIRRPPPPSMLLDPHRVSDPSNITSEIEGGDNNANPTTAAVNRAHNEMTTTLEQGQSDSIPIIPEAFLVEESEDGIVFDAEPWLPWWKRKRFVGFLLLFAAIVLAISIGVGTHVGSSRNTNVLAAELTPTISPAPSLSAAPSSSPSECALTVSTNVQKLDMQVDKPFETRIAIDKSNAVVVTREEGTTNVHIMFYLLSERGMWEKNNQYIEDYGPVTTNNGYDDPRVIDTAKISIALSGRDALVGFPFTGDGLVFAFKQNELGVWEKKEDTLKLPQNEGNNVWNFGYSIDIDGNLACIISSREVHVFQNNGNEWKETQRYVILHTFVCRSSNPCILLSLLLFLKISKPSSTTTQGD